jgi:hypothetical protein
MPAPIVHWLDAKGKPAAPPPNETEWLGIIGAVSRRVDVWLLQRQPGAPWEVRRAEEFPPFVPGSASSPQRAPLPVTRTAEVRLALLTAGLPVV